MPHRRRGSYSLMALLLVTVQSGQIPWHPKEHRESSPGRIPTASEQAAEMIPLHHHRSRDGAGKKNNEMNTTQLELWAIFGTQQSGGAQHQASYATPSSSDFSWECLDRQQHCNAQATPVARCPTNYADFPEACPAWPQEKTYAAKLQRCLEVRNTR